MEKREKQTGAYSLRLSVKNREWLEKMQNANLNPAAMINECLEKHLPETVRKELQKALAAVQ